MHVKRQILSSSSLPNKPLHISPKNQDTYLICAIFSSNSFVWLWAMVLFNWKYISEGIFQYSTFKPVNS